MARRPPDDPDRTFACPHCGEPVRRRDPACRHCGSDAATGWNNLADDDDATVELPEAMSDAGYEELLASDPAIAARRDRADPLGTPSEAVLRRRRRALYAILLALLLAFGGGLAALL